MARTVAWRFGLGAVLLGSMLAIGGCADSMGGSPTMTDKGMQPMTDKGMQPAADNGTMGSDQGMKDQGMMKDGTMQDGQGTMEKK